MSDALTTTIDVAALNRKLGSASPADIIAEACRIVGRDRVALVSSFGTESAALLKIAADVDRSIPVLFIDTQWLFEETIAYRDVVVSQLGLRDVRTIYPDPAALAARDPELNLWFSNPDACCALRKVEPLTQALKGFDAWINGRKRYHGQGRSALPVVEVDQSRLKFNPFARTAQQDIDSIFNAAGLPRHPLAVHGFTSVGCMPCTSRTRPDENIRAGRWRGSNKTECGIHSLLPASKNQSVRP